jgi:DNA-binding XRE family transcriptional regulator
MNAREIGLDQANAAYIAEISERTGQRIEAGTHQPNRGKVTERVPTQDPLGSVWEKELEPITQSQLEEHHSSICYITID